jgi:lipoic acid synthetase
MNNTESISLPVVSDARPKRRLPPWLKRPLPTRGMLDTRKLVSPNLTECWSRGTATFMILGDLCTRRCGFCAVTTKKPLPPEEDEPERMAEAAAQLKLRHVVITSVARDDLPDEGADHFARCIEATREKLPQATIEVLVPDFHARPELIKAVCDAGPEVYNHNVETVASLQKRVRPGARYQRSLGVLRSVKEIDPTITAKSGIMVGLGETRAALVESLRDLRSCGCQLLTIGQYLRPGPTQLPVEKYYDPEEFAELGRIAEELGFEGVASGPFVRSSYFAETLCGHSR